MEELLKENLLNKEWRINNLYKVVNGKNNGKVETFIRNRAQEDFNKKKHTRNVILKSRQLGFTTYEAIDSLDDCLWTEGFKALMISYDKDSALDIFDGKIAFAWEHYPDELRDLYSLDADRANKLKFDFGNGICSEIVVKNRGRSGTYNRVHISEFGKICRDSKIKEREIITGTIPSVPIGGRIDIESTAEGEEGEFHDMFWEAWNRGEPESPMQFKAHFYNWQWDVVDIANTPSINSPLPKEFLEYQLKHNLSDKEISYYYQKFLSLNSNWSRLKQEFPTTPEEAFAYSGFKLFDQEKVNDLKKYEKDGQALNDWIFYDEYKSNYRYAIGVDVAEGVGGDSSAIVVLGFGDRGCKVVAEYCSNSIAPDMLAYEIRNGALKYQNPIVAVERNNPGHATLVKLKEIYNNIYKEVKKDSELDRQTDKLGWHTNAVTKPMMMYDLSDAINEGLLESPSRFINTELRTYDKSDLTVIKASEDQSKHWDRVIALAIAYQMRTEIPAIKPAEQFKFETDKWGRMRIV